MKTLIKHITTTSFILASGFTFAQSTAQTHSVVQLSSSTALSLAVAGVKECAKDNYNVTTTVVDLTGRVLAQLRNDDATTHTLESSRKKAFTAVSMKQPTANLMTLIQDKPMLAPLQNMDDNLLFLAGGIPLKINDQIVGGIGIGGAPGGHLDVACAQAAINSVLK